MIVLLCLCFTAQQMNAQCNVALSAVETNVSCFGGSNGAIDLTVAGGTAPYTIEWSNGATDMEDIFDLQSGQYVVTVTDALGCIANLARTVNQPAQLIAGASGQNINCWWYSLTGLPIYGTELSASVQGGIPPYIYVWSNNDFGTPVNVNAAGTYTVTVIDGNSCTASAEKVILADTIRPTADAGPAVNFDCQTTELTLGGNGSATGPGISYAWTGPGIIPGAGGNSTVQFPTVNVPGAYTLKVSQTNFCQGQDVVDIGGAPPPVAHAGPDTGIPCGGGQVTLDGIGSSNGVQYVYLWATVDGNVVAGGTTLNPIVDQAGTYTLIVTDTQTGCTKSDDVKVFPGPIIPVQNQFILDVSCTGQLGEVSVTMTQGTGPYTYLWSNGSTNSNVVNVLSGTYTVTVTDATGCNYYAEEVVMEDHSNLSLSATTVSPGCNGGTNGAIDLVVNSVSGPITYAWSTAETAEDLVSLTAGTYTVTITYASATCSQTLSVILMDSSTLALSTVVTDANSCLGTNGLIDLTVTGGTGPFTYIWSDGGTNQDLVNLTTGAYTVTVTDAAGCTKTASATVGQASVFTLSAVVTASTACAFSNGAIDLTVTPGGAYTHIWSNGGTTEDLTVLQPGNYTVTVSGGGTCTAVGTYNVPNNPNNPIASAIFVPSTCDLNNGSIDASVTGGVAPYTTLWSNGATTQDLSNIPAGFYEMTVTGANGCTNTLSVDVTNNNLTFNLIEIIFANTVCIGPPNGSINLVVTPPGSYNYGWSNGATSQSINGLLPGTYAVTVSAGGSCTQTEIYTVPDQSNAPNINSTITDASCNGNDGAIDLTVTGGTPVYAYLWAGGNTSQDQNGLVSGTYTVTVTDAASCTQTASVTVGQTSDLFVSAVKTNVLCFDGNNGTIDLTTTGTATPFNYLWSNGAITADISGLAAGTYTLTVTDANLCSKTISTTITQPTDLILNWTVNNVSCFGGSNGAVNLTPSGGSPVYTYSWSNTATTQDLSNLPVGIYTVTVTDSNNCTETAIASVNQPTAFTFNIVSLSNDCSTETITGPNLPNFTYLWTGPNGFSSTTSAITVNFSGLYTLIITDLNGCTATNSYTVNLSGGGACGAITGRVFHDEDESCTLNSGEPGLAGWIVRAEGVSDTLYGVTNDQGQYLVGVPIGTYAMKVFVPNGLWTICPGAAMATVGMAGDTVSGGDFQVQSTYICPALTVSIGTNQLRRCFGNNSYEVEYCNQGTQAAQDAFVTLVLDPFLTALSSSIPYSNQGANVLRFELGTLDIGECGSFSIQVYVNCNAVLGQTHCTQASIYPDTLCVPTSANWSGASLNISSLCNTDSLRFVIQNVGSGGMNGTSGYIVVEDGIMFRSGVLPPLAENESMEIAVPANGSTWRVEVGQELFNPYTAPVGLSVEGCVATSSFSTGFVNQFPYNDEPPTVDVDCTTNIGSFDPNDKYGYPVGYGADHYVRPGTDIEYLVRFQNTGSDTAFRVEIIDTLSAWLDPATIRFGASSHPYRYDLNGEGIVHFVFENILLPDSNTNEVASHGFAKFIIKPRLDAPLETLIENTAAIYFDFNDPVFTNTTFHRLGNNFITVGLWQPVVPEARVIAMPNPFSEQTILEVSGLARTTGLRLQVFDLRGNVVREMESDNEFFQLRKGDWPSGIYLFKITQNGRLVGSGKLVAE